MLPTQDANYHLALFLETNIQVNLNVEIELGQPADGGRQ